LIGATVAKYFAKAPTVRDSAKIIRWYKFQKAKQLTEKEA
jgi:hypothetical protein